jgi:hypothetical protein
VFESRTSQSDSNSSFSNNESGYSSTSSGSAPSDYSFSSDGSDRKYTKNSNNKSTDSSNLSSKEESSEFKPSSSDNSSSDSSYSSSSSSSAPSDYSFNVDETKQHKMSKNHNFVAGKLISMPVSKVFAEAKAKYIEEQKRLNKSIDKITNISENLDSIANNTDSTVENLNDSLEKSVPLMEKEIGNIHRNYKNIDEAIVAIKDAMTKLPKNHEELVQFKEEVAELESIKKDVSNIAKHIDKDKRSLVNSIDTISAKLHQARLAKGMEQEDAKESNLIDSSKKQIENLISIEDKLKDNRFGLDKALGGESKLFCEDKCPSGKDKCGVKDGNTCFCAPGRYCSPYNWCGDTVAHKKSAQAQYSDNKSACAHYSPDVEIDWEQKALMAQKTIADLNREKKVMEDVMENMAKKYDKLKNY